MNIVITGASRGIGYETVKTLSKLDGHCILAISRNPDRLEKLRSETISSPSRVMIMAADINEQYEAVRDTVSREMGRLDILVNNAGMLVNKPFDRLENEDFDGMFNTNARAVFLLVRSLLELFNDQSHIVNIGSMGGVQGSAKFPGLSLYSASKGAISILTECLAAELGPRGIRVNCLALGAAQTEMLEQAFPGYQAPLSAPEMAGFIANFALTGQKFFNGKILPVALSTP